MKTKQNLGSVMFDICNYTFMIFLMIITLYPFLNVFAVSISGNNYVSKGEVNILPKGINIAMYKLLISTKEIQVAYLNTVLYAVAGVAVALVLNSIYAYALSRQKLPGKKFFTVFLTITMFFNGGLIPTFLVIKTLGGINTFWVMVIPGCVGAWSIIVMRTFFQDIPYSLSEAALMDGAGEVTILTKIILPLSKPLYATMALFTVVGIWNSWFNALIYLTDKLKYPIQMMLREISIVGLILNTQNAQDQIMQGSQNAQIIPLTYKYAMLMLVILPIVILYPFFQKYFIKGIMIGAIKG